MESVIVTNDPESQEANQNLEKKKLFSGRNMDLFVALLLVSVVGFLTFVRIKTTTENKMVDQNASIPSQWKDMNTSGLIGSSGAIKRLSLSRPREEMISLFDNNSGKCGYQVIEFNGNNWSVHRFENIFSVNGKVIEYPSPNGSRKILFKYDGANVYKTFDVSTQKLESIESDKAMHHPSINKEGKIIYFKDPMNTHYKSIEFDGEKWGNVKVVFDHGVYFKCPVITSDGKYLFFIKPIGNEIKSVTYTVDPNDTDTETDTKTKHPKLKNYDISFKKFVLYRKNLTNYSRPKKQAEVHANDEYLHDLILSPDSKKIAYLDWPDVPCNKRSHRSLMVVDVKSGDRTEHPIEKIEQPDSTKNPIEGILLSCSFRVIKWSNDGESIFLRFNNCDGPVFFCEYKLKDMNIVTVTDEKGDEIIYY